MVLFNYLYKKKKKLNNIILVLHVFYVYSNCEGVVLRKIKDKLHGQELVFCPRCECKYENRNTTIIKVKLIL